MPVLTPQDFTDQFFAAFDAFWTDQTTVAWPNKTFDPDVTGPAQGAAYVRPSIVDAIEGQVPQTSSVSPALNTRAGNVGFEIFTRGEGSLDQSNALRDDAMTFLERVPRSVLGAIFSKRGIQTIGFNGVWYQVNVSAAFLYFTDRAP